MGQRITGDQMIYGIAAIPLRNALRQMVNSTVRAPWFADRLSLRPVQAKRLVKDLLAAGLIENGHQKGDLTITPEGNSFAMARATRPLRRARANELLAGAIAAAEQINADGSLPSYIEELLVFGSYLGDASEIGDLDLAIVMKRRDARMTTEKWVNWAQDFGNTHSNGGSWLKVLGFQEEIIRRALKQRSSYVSLHGIDELDSMEADRKLIFKAKRVAAPRPI